MKKKSRVKKGIVILLFLLAAAAGIVFGVRYWQQNRGGAVEVYSVSDINAGDWIGYGDEEGTSGTIVSDVSQNVRIPDDKVIDQVYVEEGDKVKVGDKLLSYDTTLLELDQELQELTVQEIQLEIKAAEADLVKLKNTTPVERSGDEEEDDSSDLLGTPSFWDSYGDDDEGDEARLISGDREMLAAQEGETAAQSSQEEAPQAEQSAPQETEGESTSSEETQTTESSASQEESGSQTQTEAAMEETVIDNGENVIDNMTPDQLGETGSNQGETDVSFGTIEDAQENKAEDQEAEEPELNQSLKKFLTNIRIKGWDDQQSEVLLADTAQESGGVPVTAEISGDRIKLIPHFREEEGTRFKKLNTYTLYIKGIHLKEELSGKSYGTAVIDGNDYPEIGGFTLVQDTSGQAEDVAKLTLAFHDGLDEQQKRGILADMYVELTVTAEELTGEELIVRTSGETSDDKTIQLSKPEMEETGESETDRDAAGAEDVNSSNGDESTEPGAQDESNSNGQEPESGTETASESETDTEGESQSETTGEAGEFHVTVKWNHGTNDRSRWPETLTLRFFENAEDAEPVFTETIRGAYTENGGSGSTNGDVEPETETEAVTTANSQTDGESETETEAQGESEVIADNADPYPSYQEWTDIPVSWPSDRKSPDGYVMTVFVENYIPTVRWDGAAQSYTIDMNYLEPEESPLIKLNPLSELTYATGAEGKYYKGSGTKDDPYVFFCTDGAIIRSSFVNWVLGFNEDGTERIGAGYYVVLEIRESDSITGAFIKSVGLDGTIRVEYGYGPGTYWIFSSDSGIVRYEEEIPDEGPVDDLPGGLGDPGWSDLGETYTAEELAQAIAEKEQEIRKLNVDEKEAQLKLKKYNRELEECTVVSAVNGYVKSIGGTGDDSEAYMVVSSEGGLYVKSTVGEMDLDTVEKGQSLSCTSWETGANFSATITQVDYFPTTSNDSWGSTGNVNSSNYPILAVVAEEDQENLSEYESVSVRLVSGNQGGSGNIYIEKMYIRSENGQSYVYIADENNMLKKQYIRTGGNSYGYVEIKDGLSEEDKIAFPYGKSVKIGAKAVDTSEDDY